MKKIFICYIFLNLLNLHNVVFAEEFELEMYMHVEDERAIVFPDKNKYIQLDGSANWEDSFADYGIMKCLANISILNKENSANLEAFCEGKNQKGEKFWLKLDRSSEMDAGVGFAKYIYGENKYNSYIGLKCPYAVKYFEDRMFYKQKCKIN